MSVITKTRNIESIEKVSRRKSMEFEYTWKIDNFSVSSEFESPIFSPDCRKTIAFYLKFNGYSGCVTLCMLPCRIPDISLKLSLSLTNNSIRPKSVRTNLRPEDFKLQSSTSEKKYTFIQSFFGPANVYNDDSSDSDTNNSLQVQRKTSTMFLEISCKFQMNVYELTSWTAPIITVPECVLLDNLKKLFEKHEHSDVIFDVRGQEIPAHKIILSMHSSVFAMMFEHKMQEKLQNRVNVTDIEANVFTEMLRYIYTGKVENIETLADKLLAAAEKYNLERLKLMCQEALRVTLTVETAARTLVFADRYNAELLKVRTAEFINLNIGQVMDTEDFHAMTKSSPILMAEVLRASADIFLL